MELIQKLGAVIKLVIMPTNGEQTFFQGYDSGLMDPRIIETIFLINKTPKNISEIFERSSDNENVLTEHNLIFLLSHDKLDSLEKFKDYPFIIIFCTSNYYKLARDISKGFKVKPIICCNVKKADIHQKDVTSIYSFDKLLFSRFKDAENNIIKKTGERKISSKLSRRKVSFNTINLSSTTNNTTYSNELLIESLGYVLDKPKVIKGGSSKREFINLMINSIHSYNECLEKEDINLPSELIIYTPGMFSIFNKNNDELWSEIEGELNEIEKVFLIRGVLLNPEYSGIRLHHKGNHSGLKELLKNPKVGYLTRMRQNEMRLTTAAISLLSSSKKSPSIRLPNALNHLSSDLKKLESLARNNGIKNELFIKKAKAFNTTIKRMLGSKLRRFILNNYNELTLVSDVPLDWLRLELGKLPIMLSHEISRINSTPGNVLLQNCAYFPRISINESELKKTLVIRSFEIDDPLKHDLEQGLDVFAKSMPDLDLKIVDVKNFEEFTQALNDYDGHIVILDCHGDHGGDMENGWLIIGGEKVDTWKLRHIARVPPIVILSACLTSALSGSHASVANGFLVSGAISVIGTLLPVVSIDSSVFVSRLIYRFYQFPSVIPNSYSHVNLRLLISLFMRMSYTSDVIRGFAFSDLIDKEESLQVNSEVNAYINMLNEDWFDFLVDRLMKMSKFSKDEILEILDKDYFITETMCYSQIGFPESIVINLRM